MNILLTGATGFLGSHIAELLSKSEHRLTCLVRMSSNTVFLKSLSVQLIEAELDNTDQLKEIMTEFDVVIHCAGLVKAKNKKDYYKVNVGGTSSLLNAIALSEVKLKRFIYISSLAASGPVMNNDSCSVSANDSHPVSIYGLSKLMAEKEVIKAGNNFPVTIIRPPVIYGPRDQNIASLFQLIRRGIIILPMQGACIVSVIYVTDAAQAIIKAALLPSSQCHLFHISDTHDQSIHQRFFDIAKIITPKINLIIKIPFFILNIFALYCDLVSTFVKQPSLFSKDKLKEIKCLNWTCDSTNAMEQLAWSPEITWQEGIHLTDNWCKEQ